MSIPLSAAATPPPQPSPRFTLELEFVLCLANPYYLQYLAVEHPHLLNPPLASASASASASSSFSAAAATANPDSDYACFSRYLAYLYAYWRTPQYSQYLTHPGAVLRNLELLQHERFKRDVIKPDVIARLLESGAAHQENETAAMDRENAAAAVVRP